MEALLNISAYLPDSSHPGYLHADSLRQIQGKTLLQHQLDALFARGIERVHILAPKGSESQLSSYASPTVMLHYVRKGLGTAGALGLFAEEEMPFLFIPGNVYADIDPEAMLRFHEEHEAYLTVLTHPEPHPEQKDVVLTRKNDQILVLLDKERTQERDFYYHNVVPTEVAVISPEILMTLDGERLCKTDFKQEVFLPTIGVEGAYAYGDYEYVRPLNGEEDFAELERDLASGVPAKKRIGAKKRAFFLDRDGTLTQFGAYVVRPEMLKLIDGAAQAVKKINEAGDLAILITNQPLVARKQCSMETMNEILAHLEMLLGEQGAYLDAIYFCPHYPHQDKLFDPEYNKDCDCRKPHTGMIDRAKQKFGIDPSVSWMIGDSLRDIKTANNAGVKGIRVQSGDPDMDDRFLDAYGEFEAKDVLEAIEKAL